ncbi:MAG TPA: uroporphyrinogen-III C-methyltransferase [Casimicrobiaceae bacterium]|nr:uroporphyrinogen-III C-methyltransferase [Casimicrobiaceae bacterium]
MSDPAEPLASTPPADPAAPVTRLASRGFVIGASALLAVALLAVWLDARRDVRVLREDAARRLATAEAALAQSRERENRLDGEVREAQAKLALLDARVAESQSQQAALEALYREMAPSRDDLALTEVEQILLIANQQLALAGNVPSALAALQLADGKLARMDRPQIAPLRRALARDVERLRAVPFIDVTAITLKLDGAIAVVDTLPLAKDERLPPPKPEAPPPEQPAWRRLLENAWEELRSLVRLEISERPMAPLVTREQAYFLRENLRLRLLSARIAILGRQEASYKADLRAALAWTRQYFDMRTKQGQQLQETLSQMLNTPVPDDLPDLGASLDAVRALKAVQEHRAPPPAPPRPGR